MANVAGQKGAQDIRCAAMLPCVECGNPIRYALNRGVKITSDRTPATYHDLVGERCEHCALRHADDQVRSVMGLVLRSLENVRDHFSIPPSGTLQSFHLVPGKAALRGFSMETIGVWVKPIEDARHVYTLSSDKGPIVQFLAITDIVRHDDIPTELHWIRLPYERVEIRERDGQASITQMKHLMNGLRFLREEHNRRAGKGGRPSKEPPVEVVLSIRREMEQEHRDRGVSKPTWDEINDRLYHETGIDMKADTLRKYMARKTRK